MSTRSFLRLAAPALALTGAALLLGPAPRSQAYSLLGGSLGTGQRDFRVHNNFTDPTANDNLAPDAQFPGHQGAVLAVWKACVEWGSELHGSGDGDPHQPGDLGSGGANFDPSFQGQAAGVGGTNDNIHSEIAGGSGGVLAYCESPISNGWRIRYYSDWTWDDGPNAPLTLHKDLQGVAVHEYGHALGLDHSGSVGATMYPSVFGTGVGQRSIAADDVAGVQAIYGPRSASKPRITGVSSAGVGQITIQGSGFHAGGNEVWFTNKNVTAAGANPTVKVTGLTSSQGGTVLDVTLPVAAGSGDVLVKNSSSGHASLSNAWPLDVTAVGAGPPLAIGSLSPGSVDALTVGSAQGLTILGTGFTPTTTVEVDGVPLFGIPSPYTVVDANTITLDPPPAAKLGGVPIVVRDGADSDSATLTYVANATPALQAGDGDAPVTFLSASGLELRMASLPGETFFLLASPSATPTILPGTFSLGIGNGGSQLWLIAQMAIGPDGGASLTLPVTLPPLTTFYLQGLALGAGGLPLTASNVQECQLLF